MFYFGITADSDINANISKGEKYTLSKKEFCQKLQIISKKMSHLKFWVFIQKEY